MEKLIELLNEYGTQEEIKWKWYFVPNHIQWEGCDNSECSDLLIISKKFWFIKWLVENDKIDFYEWKYLENPIWSNNYDECDYLELIQRLSISDTPIEDLISYLK